MKNLKRIWAEKYKIVPDQLKKVALIPSVATGFNANIDAILKISGKKLKALINENSLTLNDVENIQISSFSADTDVIRGIVKCFTRGIAEEWITDDINIYKWMEKHLGYNRLQMGGQGGIIANALALLGVQKVITHTNSHPKLQAEQFLDLDNLLGFDENGKLCKAKDIRRDSDIPLVHWIIEFDKDDSFVLDGKEFKCPKSNRFIATYDPLNMKLVMNDGFITYINENKISYLLLSGFHALIEKNDGVNLVKNSVSVIKRWKKNNPDMIVHLEIASTQDKAVRKAIIQYIAPLCESVGLNERETIDLLESYGQVELAKKIESDTHSSNLFEAIWFLKKQLKVKRIQLHMFGLYLTIQDKNIKISPEQSLNGMITAAIVSSSKALNGELVKYEDLTKSLGTEVSSQGLTELSLLADILKCQDLLEKGICDFENCQIIAVPTILIDKPKTLVGMGDTISSVSLLASM